MFNFYVVMYKIYIGFSYNAHGFQNDLNGYLIWCDIWGYQIEAKSQKCLYYNTYISLLGNLPLNKYKYMYYKSNAMHVIFTSKWIAYNI